MPTILLVTVLLVVVWCAASVLLAFTVARSIRLADAEADAARASERPAGRHLQQL